jgi:hypothetical protein
MKRQIAYEQAVYGSFPFWDRGYGILAWSAGCRAEWLDALRMAAQRFGERPAGVVEQTCFFALRLARGPWMIVGVFPQGSDDKGRPGALAFHAIFVSRLGYWWAGANPFVALPVLRGSWSESQKDLLLRSGRLAVAAPLSAPASVPEHQIQEIVKAIKRGQKVVIDSAEPIEELARAIWRRLPGRVRRRASVASWAFCNANQFDLVAIPPVAIRP